MTLRASIPSALFAAAGLAVAAILVFWGLGDRYLWDDEAENALLARSILATGLPIARDGHHVLSQGCGGDADQNYLWTFHAWLPMYLTAGAFDLFGVTTFAARFPFAVLGFLAIPSLYVVGRRLFAERAVALLACVILTLSVPFLLHVRQSRYYAIAVLAGVWMLHVFVGVAEGRNGALLGFVAASTLMLHANHPMFPATFGALLVAFAIVYRDVRALGRVLVAGLAAVLVNAPLLAIYGGGWLVGFGAAPGGLDWGRKASEAAAIVLVYLRRIDFVLLPALVVVLFAIWVLVEGRETVWRSPGFRRALFLLVYVLVFVLTLSPLPTVFLRYLMGVLPALALVLAWMIRTVAAKRLAVAVAASAVLLLSDASHGWLSGLQHRLEPGQLLVRWPLLLYLEELTSDFTGPIEAIVGYLRAHAKPGDRVYITYGDYPLRFYTTLDVRGGQGCESPVVVPPPEWVVVRFFFRSANTAPGSTEDIQRHMRYVREEIPWRLYQRIELPVVDTVWENIPEPQWHHFRTPTSGPRVVIHRRVAGPGVAGPGQR